MADGDRKKPNGNWSAPHNDGHPLQDVGEWVKVKHDILHKYIEASSGPRGMFLQPRGNYPPSGAAYVELFAGPGKARIRITGEIIDGSPLLAVEHQKSPFTKVILCDLASANVAALRARTAADSDRVVIIEGDCNDHIGEVVRHIPPRGLNIALIDPFGLEPLRFETIRKLAMVAKMDLIVHFPASDIKRNLRKDERYPDRIDRFLGTDTWRPLVIGPGDVPKLIEVLRSQLAPFGYEQRQVRSVAVNNSKNSPLYDLVYIAKHEKGSKIWRSIVRNSPDGQKGWDM